VPERNRLLDALASAGLERAPKQAWTPVAEFSRAGLDAVNFGPGDPAQAHAREESVEVSALVRSFRVLSELAA
jgi:succinyl-diaminopimelate desuccinylase